MFTTIDIIDFALIGSKITSRRNEKQIRQSISWQNVVVTLLEEKEEEEAEEEEVEDKDEVEIEDEEEEQELF